MTDQNLPVPKLLSVGVSSLYYGVKCCICIKCGNECIMGRLCQFSHMSSVCSVSRISARL